MTTTHVTASTTIGEAVEYTHRRGPGTADFRINVLVPGGVGVEIEVAYFGGGNGNEFSAKDVPNWRMRTDHIHQVASAPSGHPTRVRVKTVSVSPTKLGTIAELKGHEGQYVLLSDAPDDPCGEWRSLGGALYGERSLTYGHVPAEDITVVAVPKKVKR